MIRVLWIGRSLLAVLVGLAGLGCQLRRPDVMPNRMIEPQFLDPQLSEPEQRDATADKAAPIRLLDTQARGHIGRRLLYQQPSGELTEDPIWRWSSAPDRYLDTAIRLALASSPTLRLVDAASAPALAPTLLVWNLESGGETRLVGTVEFQFTGADRVVHTHVVRESEPTSAELPGDLAVVSGRLLRRLAAEGVTRVARDR